MPYISSNGREHVDPLLQSLINHVNGLPFAERAGVYAYAVTNLAIHGYAPWDFQSYATMLGVLDAAKSELYRRMVAPYEDYKRAANGDLNWTASSNIKVSKCSTCSTDANVS